MLSMCLPFFWLWKHRVAAVHLSRSVGSGSIGSRRCVWCHSVTSLMVSGVVWRADGEGDVVYLPTRRRKKKAIITVSPIAFVFGQGKLLPRWRRYWGSASGTCTARRGCVVAVVGRLAHSLPKVAEGL